MGTVNLTLPPFANRGAFKKGIISDLFCVVGFFGVSGVSTTNGAAFNANTSKSKGVSVLTHLTVKPLVDILNALSPHVAVGIETPRKGEKSPLTLVVFFRPSFLSNTGLIRVVFVMVDCLREALRLARSFAGSLNLTQSTAPLLRPAGSGTPSHKGITTMSRPKSTQPTQAQTDKANLLATLKQDLDNTINALPVQHSVKFRKALNHVQVVCDFLSKNLHDELFNFEQIVDINLLCLHEMRERQALANAQNQNA